MFQSSYLNYKLSLITSTITFVGLLVLLPFPLDSKVQCSSKAETSRAVSFAYRLIPIPSLKSIVPSCSLVAWLFRLDCGPNWLLRFPLKWSVKITLVTIWLKGHRWTITSWEEMLALSRKNMRTCGSADIRLWGWDHIEHVITWGLKITITSW